MTFLQGALVFEKETMRQMVVVEKPFTDDPVKCIWFSEDDQTLKSGTFAQTQLDLVDPTEDPEKEARDWFVTWSSNKSMSFQIAEGPELTIQNIDRYNDYKTKCYLKGDPEKELILEDIHYSLLRKKCRNRQLVFPLYNTLTKTKDMQEDKAYNIARLIANNQNKKVITNKEFVILSSDDSYTFYHNDQKAEENIAVYNPKEPLFVLAVSAK